eukprot:COSAG02_NODE_1440_length_12590_cov_2.822352_2_plen_108_part_00
MIVTPHNACVQLADSSCVERALSVLKWVLLKLMLSVFAYFYVFLDSRRTGKNGTMHYDINTHPDNVEDEPAALYPLLLGAFFAATAGAMVTDAVLRCKDRSDGSDAI